MSGITIEILLILALILLNGVFAMAETALISARRSRLQEKAEAGNSGAGVALKLIETPNRFLSTVQIGISLIGVLAGAVGGATISEPLAAWIAAYPALEPYSHAIALAFVVLVITYFSLVLGELVPKRLALNSPESVSSSVAPLMRTVARLTRPFVSLLSGSTDLVLRLLRVRPSHEPPVTAEEIRILLEQGTETGVFEEVEQDMVESVFRLGERRVGALMTPRVDIAWIDINEPLPDILETVVNSNHSRFPVAEDNLDNAIGIVAAKDLLSTHISGQTVDLRQLLQPPVFFPESTPALKALEMLKSTGVQMGMVIDEFGGMQGIVTLYDVLESIVGEIPEAGQQSELEIVRREDGSWLFDGMLPIDEFKELLSLDDLPEEDRAGFQTVGGFIVSQLGEIPKTGQHFIWNGWKFEVMDMDGLRVDKVLASPIPQAAAR